MSTTIAHTSRETVARLIRNEFEKCTMPWHEQDAKDLIKTARDFGLEDEANQMQNDL